MHASCFFFANNNNQADKIPGQTRQHSRLQGRFCETAEDDVDNDNDNDTLREVPHPSNEGLALQARVSGPWPHKKESVLLVELARWQGVQTQTVNGQSAMQQVLR